MNALLALTAEASGKGSSESIIIVVYVILIGAMMYFMLIKPQKKQRKEQAALMSSMEVGDSVMTTAGFYGVIIDMTDDTVIVEFGNNKNCRIPMQKQAIIQIEKPTEVG